MMHRTENSEHAGDNPTEPSRASWLSANPQRSSQTEGPLLVVRLSVGQGEHQRVLDQQDFPPAQGGLWVGTGTGPSMHFHLDCDTLLEPRLRLAWPEARGWKVRVPPGCMLTLTPKTVHPGPTGQHSPVALTVKGSRDEPERARVLEPSRHQGFTLEIGPYRLEGWFASSEPLLPWPQAEWLDPVLVRFWAGFAALAVLVLLLASWVLPESQVLKPPPLEERWVRLPLQESTEKPAVNVQLDKRSARRLKPLTAKKEPRPPKPEEPLEVKPKPTPKPQPPDPVEPTRVPERVAVQPRSTPTPAEVSRLVGELPEPARPERPSGGVTGSLGLTGSRSGREAAAGLGELSGPSSQGKSSGGVTGSLALTGSRSGREAAAGLGELSGPSSQGKSSGGVTGGFAMLTTNGSRTAAGGLGELPAATGRTGGGGVSGSLALPSGSGGGRGGGRGGGQGLGELGSGSGSSGSGGGSSGSGGGGVQGSLGGGGSARVQQLQRLTWIAPSGEGAYISATERERLSRKLASLTCKLAPGTETSRGGAILSADDRYIYLEGADQVKARVPRGDCGDMVFPQLSIPPGRPRLSQIEALKWCLDRLQ